MHPQTTDASESLLVNRSDLVVVLTLNRPPANALNSDLISKLLATVRALTTEDAPPGIVLTGQGNRFFTAGGDIKEALGLDATAAAARLSMLHTLLCELERYPAPFLCGVRGYAVGGGFELVLHADHIVASDDAQLGFPEIKNGLLPAAKGIRKAALKLGQRAAKTMLFSGDLVHAVSALHLGAIDEIVASEDVTSHAVAACRALRKKDQRLFAAIKRSLNLTLLSSDEELDAMSVRDLAAYFDDERSAEARASFFKRPAERG